MPSRTSLVPLLITLVAAVPSAADVISYTVPFSFDPTLESSSLDVRLPKFVGAPDEPVAVGLTIDIRYSYDLTAENRSSVASPTTPAWVAVDLDISAPGRTVTPRLYDVLPQHAYTASDGVNGSGTDFHDYGRRQLATRIVTDAPPPLYRGDGFFTMVITETFFDPRFIAPLGFTHSIRGRLLEGTVTVTYVTAPAPAAALPMGLLALLRRRRR